jgi:hypothetical protein
VLKVPKVPTVLVLTVLVPKMPLYEQMLGSETMHT